MNGIARRGVPERENMTLAEARLKRNGERKTLKEGIETIAQKRELRKKVQEEARTFGIVAEEWLEFWRCDKDNKTTQSAIGRSRKHILPVMGEKSYGNLAFSDLKAVCADCQCRT